MTRILEAVHLALKILLGLLIAGLIVPVTMQVLSRYTGIIPRYIWTEEIARFCFIWIIMVGAICAVRDSTHFDVDILPKSENPRTAALQRLVVHLVILFVAGIFVWYGWRFILFGWFQTSEIFGLPMTWIFGAWPVAGVLMALFVLEKIWNEIRILRGDAP
jgi:TRAP-type C4-dicarboxylate transport system permease small subunit